MIRLKLSSIWMLETVFMSATINLPTSMTKILN